MTGKLPKAKKEKKVDIPIYTAASRVNVSDDDRERLKGVVGYEGGNGKGGIIFLNKKGLLQRTILPNARIRVTGDRLAGDRVGVRVPYAQVGMDKWGYSDALWHISGRVDTFQSSPERYGSPEHVFPLLVMMAENDLADGAYALLVTVPPGYYNSVMNQVEEGFSRGEVMDINGRKEYTGQWTITLSKDEKRRTYAFPRVFVTMEAADAGYAAFRYDLQGNVVKKRGADGFDFLGGRVRVVDLGFGTCDTPTLIDSKLLEDGLSRASDAQGGILVNIAEPIMGQVVEQIPETRDWLTTAHVDYWLRRYATGFTDAEGKTVRPWTSEAAQVSISGKILHLHSAFEHYAEQYARYAYRQILAASTEQSDVALAIGGGWLYAINHVQRWYKESGLVMQFFTHQDVPHLKDFSFVDINLAGLMALAIVLIREGVLS